MGKKRIVAKTEEELLKETEGREAAQQKAIRLREKPRARTEEGRVFIQSTYNNTIITVTDNQGNVLAWASSGSVGFKGPRKATPFAASRVVEVLMEKVKKIGLRQASVFVKGVGSGREAALRALVSHGLEITLIKDVTPVPHNGCRPPKVRRV